MPPIEAVYKDEVEVLKDYVYNFNNARIAFNREENVLETVEKALKKLQKDLDWLKELRWNLKHRNESEALKGTVFEKDDEFDFQQDFINYKRSMIANVEQILGYLKILGKMVCWIEDKNHKLEEVLTRMAHFDKEALEKTAGEAQKEVSKELSDLKRVLSVVEKEEGEFSKFMKTLQSMIKVLSDYQQKLALEEEWDEGYVDDDLLIKTQEQLDFLRPLLRKWGSEFFDAKKLDEHMDKEFNMAETMIKGLQMEKQGAMQQFEKDFKEIFIDIPGR